ncbi:1-phosphatidylinositol 3-phosphate 5-kinase-like [Macrobrachium nipponense]|uniref:1-phosphatidylinositol 3-phosphate 5-kinase-like n=1 Tax=Macrobrachium nipponense TaxID=159736 RepID=UPI0030C86257
MLCDSEVISNQFHSSKNDSLIKSVISNTFISVFSEETAHEAVEGSNQTRINNKMGNDIGVNHRPRRYLPIRLLGRPPSTTAHTPFMVAEANNNRYQYMPLKDDGSVHELDPCPAPSSPSGGGGSNVFALLTFSVVTANVLINAVANVNSNNNNNNNNENNNNDNVNNENVSSNMDSNTNNNMIVGRAFGSRSNNSTKRCSCSWKSKRLAKRRAAAQKSFHLPRSLVSCAPRVICETSRVAAATASSASELDYFLQSFSGLSTRAAVDSYFPPSLLRDARMLGLKGGSCESKYQCSLVDWITK